MHSQIVCDAEQADEASPRDEIDAYAMHALAANGFGDAAVDATGYGPAPAGDRTDPGVRLRLSPRRPVRRVPTVALLHSSASSARQWDRLIGTLQPRFRVVAIDFHGHGAQPDWRADRPLTLADDAALVEPLLAQTGGVHVVGHSYGAAVALKLATMHPSSIHSVVAYEPVLFRLLIDDPTCRRLAQDVLAAAAFVRSRLALNETVAAAKRFIDFWSGDGSWESLTVARQHTVAVRMRAVLRHFDALFREPAPHGALARVHLPMLLLTGAQTVSATNRIGEILRAALPTARHEVLPAMGHMGPITHAEDVNRRISDFLEASVSLDPDLRAA